MKNNANLIDLYIGKNLKISFPKAAVISNDDRSLFVFSEKNKTYRAKNPNKKIGCKLQIDGQLYLGNIKKCDNGLLLEDSRFFLIELKGVNVCYACEQLLTTSKQLKQDYKGYNFDFFYRIVSRQGLPPKTNTKEQIFKRIMGKDKVVIKENLLEEDI